MCGVAGIFAYHYASPDVDLEELRKIRDAMALRGPDGYGEWLSDDQRIGLGHRRLSIIDLSETANQPMISRDGLYVISFNGEIYNYKELRKDLEKKGFCFRTNSDTEVLLQLYLDQGADMFLNLRGMFAFALWDGQKKKMLLARDPYGIKPLYYADDGWTLRIASQVNALLASPRVSKDPEPAGMAGFFLWGSVPEPFTFYQEIRAVPAGSYLWVDACGVSEIQTYFSIAKTYHDAVIGKGIVPDGPSSAQSVRNALLDSVKQHFVADVPVGVFLSSGLDSSSLLALASQAGFSKLKTVTLAFDEFKGTVQDEAPLAAETAKFFGSDHHVYLLTRKEFERELPRMLAAMDQPTIDGINTYFVSKAAAAAGLKVALSGVGGDELFGGYPSFRDVPSWSAKTAFPAKIPFAGLFFRYLAEKLLSPHKLFHPKFFSMLEYGGTCPGAYFLKRGLFMPWELESLLGRDMARSGLARLSLLKTLGQTISPDPLTSFGRVSTLESCWYMKNQLLRDTDWAGMAHSLEIRTPLVDAILLKQIAALSPHDCGTPSKIMLKEAVNNILPAALNRRSKTGFTVPMEQWLQGMNSVPKKKRAVFYTWPRTWAYQLYTKKAA